MSPRVMQLMAGAPHGGAELFFERLAIALADSGLDQHLVIRPDPDRQRRLQAAGITPRTLPFGGRLDVRTRLGLRRLIGQLKPDLVLSWMNRATLFCPPAAGRFVQVARLGGYYDLKYYRGCDHLIGNTEDIVDYLVRQGWPAERAHHLPNFVSQRRAEPESRKTHYTPIQAPLIFALGRLHPNKGFDVLIRALARVPDAYLWLAGEGPLRAELEALAQELGVKPRVRFLGWREDVAPLFAAADLFVCPSRHEPLGNVVLEAWAQGLPVVAADALGPGTLIEHGENGLLAPTEDAQALAKAIKAVISQPALAEKLADKGLAAFEAGHTEEKVVSAYRAFFERITRRGD